MPLIINGSSTLTRLVRSGSLSNLLSSLASTIHRFMFSRHGIIVLKIIFIHSHSYILGTRVGPLYDYRSVIGVILLFFPFNALN